MSSDNLVALISNTAIKLGEYFDDEQLAKVTSREQLHQQLTQLIIYLLLHKMELLLQVLYRIDVFEKDTKAAFAQNNPQLIAPILANLIIDRELIKAETRLKYRNL
jgi:hypothetical protein